MFFGKNGPSRIGLLAGQGELPVLFAEAARELKKEIVLIGVRGYTDKKIEALVSEAHYVELGSLAGLPELFKRANVKKVVLAGSVPKKELTNSEFRLDADVAGVVTRSGNRGDDHLLRAFEAWLKLRCGVSVMDSRSFLRRCLAPKGVFSKRVPTQAEWADLRFGRKIAKEIGRLDVGQTVVVKGGIVLAVEAIEGTDQAIRRGGQLGHGDAVVVKVAKPNQNLRFDLPCAGLDTLESMKAVSSRVLGVEAGKTLLVHRDRLIEAADRDGVALVGL